MALDHRRGISRDGHRLDDIRIQRALGEKLGRPCPLRRRLKNFDERFADDLAFAFGISHPFEAAQK